MSFSKIRDRLGYEPRWSVDDGIQQVVEAVASGKLGDFQDVRYSNAKFLSESGTIASMKAEDNWVRQFSSPNCPAQVALRR